MLSSHGSGGLSWVVCFGEWWSYKGEQMTLLLIIMILIDNLAILYLLDAVHFLLEQYDVIDILLETRREDDD